MASFTAESSAMPRTMRLPMPVEVSWVQAWSHPSLRLTMYVPRWVITSSHGPRSYTPERINQSVAAMYMYSAAVARASVRPLKGQSPGLASLQNPEPNPRPKSEPENRSHHAYHHDLRAPWISSHEISRSSKRHYRADKVFACEHYWGTKDSLRWSRRDFL
jgi:hypothetical protein